MNLTLGFLDISSLLLSGVTVEQNIGTGLFVNIVRRKVIIIHCNFVRNNEHIRRNHQCNPPNTSWTCYGGNVRLFFVPNLFRPHNQQSTDVEISHSLFSGGVAALNYHNASKLQVIPQAAGLEVICAPTFELNITISNTVFKNNSGPYGGNIYIAVSELSLRHPQIMVHNCNTELGNTELFQPKLPAANCRAAGLVYQTAYSKEFLDRRRTSILRISNTLFLSNFGCAVAFMVVPPVFSTSGAVYSTSHFGILVEN